MVRQTEARLAFREITDTFINVVSQIPSNRWNDTALGVWTVRDLVGHTSRALRTLAEYSQSSASTVGADDAAEYYELSPNVSGGPEIKARADAAIAERGREAGRMLGSDPSAAIRRLADEAFRTMDATADEVLISVGTATGIRFGEYLRTRVFELTVHTLDIVHALGMPLVPPQSAMHATLVLMSEIAVRRGLGTPLLLAATGRGPLPTGFSVLG